MINRSKLKYYLKKILPRSLFLVILFLWRTFLLRLIELIDVYRAKRFTTYHAVTLNHNDLSFKLFISPENGFIDRYIFLYGIYEPFIFDIFREYIKEGMTVVDVGTNIGEHTMYAACCVGKKGKVYSFEPIPKLYNQLLDSVKINNFESIVTARNCALGQEESSSSLYVSKNAGGSSIVHQDNTEEAITVSIKKGDEELKNAPSIDFIKIDVEGYEYEVLAGMEKVIQKNKPIICMEFSGDLYLSQGKDHGNLILSFLQKNKYALYDIEHDRKKIEDSNNFLSLFPKKIKQTNLLCIPLEK